MARKTKYHSVEVAMKTDHPYDAFVQWVEEQDNYCVVVPCETHRAYIYFQPLPCGDKDKTIQFLCSQIAGLPKRARKQWDAAGLREFYLGYHVGDEPFCYDSHLSFETVSAMVSIGAGIGWALYVAPPDDEEE